MGGFLLLVATMLAIDLGLVNKKDHVVSVREALVWTCVWIGMALLFWVFIAFRAEWIHGITTFEQLEHFNTLHGHGLELDPAAGLEQGLRAYRSAMSLEYLTGYLIEKALSVDNIFVMIMIFLSFRVEPRYYHKILFWGIVGAVVLRFTFIFAAAALIQRFVWVLWVFGGILVFSGVKMLFHKDEEGERDMKKHPLVRFVSRRFRMTRKDYDGRFMVRLRHHWYITPLLLVLVVIEASDVIFA
ncbi:MAG: TerC family protein, partial [Alistipes sp.]|nr:TerC family protein [Alistipes sp.]